MVERIKQYASEADVTAVLLEAEDALRAIRHGSMGLQPGADPLQEAKRLPSAAPPA